MNLLISYFSINEFSLSLILNLCPSIIMILASSVDEEDAFLKDVAFLCHHSIGQMPINLFPPPLNWFCLKLERGHFDDVIHAHKCPHHSDFRLCVIVSKCYHCRCKYDLIERYIIDELVFLHRNCIF